jgi:uncharacterized LabA/DUF88 family protein
MVFIDYENTLRSARSRFHPRGAANTDGHIDPGALAQLLVGRRREASVLERAFVYRGRPNPNYQRSASAASDRQADRWTRDSRVEVCRRMLRYPVDFPSSPPTEKGVDVLLATDLLTYAFTSSYDVAIVVSRDTDLLPAMERVEDMRLARVEVAGWRGTTRLRYPDSAGPWCHFLDGADYEEIRDTTDYLKGRN